MKTITIMGGGNSAHVLIPLLSKAGLKVNLLTRKPKQWSNNIALDYMLPSGELKDVFEGTIDKISSNPKDVIPESDIIMFCISIRSKSGNHSLIKPRITKPNNIDEIIIITAAKLRIK